MRGKFNNIAKLIKESREASSLRYSQKELSCVMGYTNGQFISNIERGLCSLPLKKINHICSILNISPDVVRETLVKDFYETLDFVISKKETENDSASNAH